VGRFLRCPTCGFGGWCQLAAEPPSERSTQRGLAYWQIRELREKNHRVNIVLPVGLQSSNTSLVFIFYIFCLCSCSCN
jgi:hypothetical protein